MECAPRGGDRYVTVRLRLPGGAQPAQL